MKGKENRINTRTTGTHYEQEAGRFLEVRGYRILQYNYRCRFAEIDIVAENEGYLVFCEVKYRRDSSIPETLEAVDLKKQHQICRAALFYMREHRREECACRFDVIAICGERDKKTILIKNAFDFS